MFNKSIDWEAAINTRRSIRSYEMRAVEEREMALMQNFISDLHTPFDHKVKIRLFKANPDKKLYTIFAAPPDGAAFLAGTDVCSVSAAGFVGEMLVLYATSLGLSTCWYGHYTLAELERIMPHLGEYAVLPQPKWGYGKGEVPGERAICVTPLGYWQKRGLRLVDRAQEMFISFKRKPVGTFVEAGQNAEKLPPDILYALDLARKAPSGANSQHWRFRIDPDLKKISLAMPVGYKHIKWEHPDADIGICACHLWLGLAMKNVACKISLNEEQGRAAWEFIPV